MIADALIVGHKDWIDETWLKLEKKMRAARRKAEGLTFIPYTVQGNEWQPGPMDGISWWTNGFWPATMLQMYVQTGEAAYLGEAERAEFLMDEAFREFDHLHHDVGFMWHISSGARFRLNGNDEARRRVLKAATMLAGRFNPNGFIRAWNGDCIGWAIIDCMMNIQLLFWASEFTGDPRFAAIGAAHADTTMKYFVREDGSVNHIVKFDPSTMEVLEMPGGQGFKEGSSWSRGQAWALYGFTLAHMHTGKAEYLETALKVARYFIDNVQNDWVPRCDFRQPAEPDLRDTCATGIASCALIELSKLPVGAEAECFLNAAVNMLRAADERCCDWSEENPSVLQMCTGSYHSERDRHVAMIYGDYFFIEAMGKLRGEKLLFW